MVAWPIGTRILRTPKGLAYARGIIGHTAAAPTFQFLLSHGVGHHKEIAWLPVLPHLAAALTASKTCAQFIALDFSGHGKSRSTAAGHRWDTGHGDDVAEVLTHAHDVDGGTAPLPRVGVGVSMGGAVLCAHELRRPGSFAHLVAIEPPLFTRVAAKVALTVSRTGANWMADKAARRRSTWPSRDAARTHIAARGGKRWTSEALDAFVEHGGLREADDGSVTLACDPRTEGSSMRWPGVPLPDLAQGYTGAASFSLFACAESQFSPIGVPGSGIFFYRNLIAPSFPHGGARFRTLGQGATHAIGQEQPALLAEAVAQDLRDRGLT